MDRAVLSGRRIEFSGCNFGIDDLEALVEAGTAVDHSTDVDGETATVAYDVKGVDRPEWDARFQRAVDVHRETLRRMARR